MNGELTLSLGTYISVSLLGTNIRQFGTEAIAAGVVGVILTLVHIASTVPSCRFDSYNVWTSFLLLLSFVILYFVAKRIEKAKPSKP